VSDCPSCGSVLTGKICRCGYAVRVAVPPSRGAFKTEPSAILRQKMGEQQIIVDAFVAKYQLEHPGSTKRDACLAFLKAEGIQHMLPKQFLDFDSAMDKYREELEA
jgi:hypothetical protein